MRVGALGVLVACASIGGCAGATVKPATSPAPPPGDAVLVLPGFGYDGDGEATLRSLAPAMARDGFALYVPAYVSRGGLAAGRAKLRRFMRDQRLERYRRLHVFAFIAGGWTLNPLVEMDRPPNLATVVYDRSPYQERAPRIADETLHFLTWVRYGTPVFDVARTPYAPLSVPGVKVGIVVETTPTNFVKKRAKTARSYGPFHFECEAFLQPHDDCIYVPWNHDELYVRFADVWPELLAFIRSGRFTAGAVRTPPAGDALAGIQ
jgi:hypothetical protein